jgi:hypothetical protein
MRVFRTKSEPATEALAAIGSRTHRGSLVKAAMIVCGVAALTAESAAVSSLRRRMEPIS